MHYELPHGHPDTRTELEDCGVWPRTWYSAFHVEGQDFQRSVAIDTPELVIGSAPMPVLKVARGWAEDNVDLLMATWQELTG